MYKRRELRNLIDEGSLLLPLPLTYHGCGKWLRKCARIIPKFYPDHAWRFAIFPGSWDITNMLLFLRYLLDREMLIREKLLHLQHLKASSV